MAAVVTPAGLHVPLTTLATVLGRYYQCFVEKLVTIESIEPGRKQYGPARSDAAFIRTGPLLTLPRRYATMLPLEVTYKCPPVRKVDVGVFQKTLYDYQHTILEDIVRTFQKNSTYYLKMDTGMGKTWMGIAVIHAMEVPALIIVPTEVIRGQWVADLALLTPGLRVKSYTNKAPVTPDACDVAVVIVNTARDKKPAFAEHYGLVILDEAHEYISPSNRKVLWVAQTRYVLGLSATPLERADGMDQIVVKHLGRPVDTQTIVPPDQLEDSKFVGRVREVWYYGTAEDQHTSVGFSPILTIGETIKEEPRLHLVAAEVVRLINLGRDEGADWGLLAEDGRVKPYGIFVFAEHREYLPMLKLCITNKLAALGVYAPVSVPELEDIEATNAEQSAQLDSLLADLGMQSEQAPPVVSQSVLRGGASNTDVQEATGADIVLTTYGYSRRGVSMRTKTALVLATSRRNGMTQILGRILRKGSDQSIVRCVVDVRDMKTKLSDQAYTRREAYRAKEYPITKVAYRHEECGADMIARPTAEEIAI